VGDPAPDVRLVVPDPDELRRGEPGQRVVAGDRDQPLGPDGPADRVAFRTGALVVPQNRRPENVAGRIEQDRAVHLAGQADRRHVRPAGLGGGEHGADGRHRPVPPEVWLLLAPQRARDAERVLGRADAADDPCLVDQDGLRRGGGCVDAEDDAHGGQPAERPVDQMAWLTMFSYSSCWPETGCGSIEPASTRAASSSRLTSPPRIARPSSPVQPA
jgi:hypothetical protein